jgi:hypothetical protein
MGLRRMQNHNLPGQNALEGRGVGLLP